MLEHSFNKIYCSFYLHSLLSFSFMTVRKHLDETSFCLKKASKKVYVQRVTFSMNDSKSGMTTANCLNLRCNRKMSYRQIKTFKQNVFDINKFFTVSTFENIFYLKNNLQSSIYHHILPPTILPCS